MDAKTVIIASFGLFVTGHAFGAPTEITNDNQGRYDKNGQSAGDVGPIANYIVGTQNGIPDPSQGYPGFSYDFANFFAFDLTGIAPGKIVGASVTISGGQNVFQSGPNGIFSLYASTVDPAADESGFLSGLATDDLIGKVTVWNGGSLGFDDPVQSDIRVTFNAAGLADLNAAAGSAFYVGGTFTGAAPYVLLPGPGGLTFANLFNGSGNVSGAELALDLTVPESSTWAMMLAGFAALGAAGYKAGRRRAAVAR